MVWQLALSVVGARTTLPSAPTTDAVPNPEADGAGPALRVSDDPAALGPGDVLVTLPALARAAPELPAGVVDYNAEVGPQPDALVTAVTPTPLLQAGDPVREGVPRVLVVVEDGDEGPAAPLAEVVLPTLRQDGSVVLVHRSVDPEPLVGPEQVTRRWGEGPGIS